MNKNKQKTISSLEQQVMDIIWELKECSVRDVLTKLKKNKSIAYTTVATLFNRLEAKGLIKKQEQGKAYIYKPILSKKSYSKNLAQSFLKTFVSSFGDTAIASFAESIEELPKEKREYFLKLLEHEATK